MPPDETYIGTFWLSVGASTTPPPITVPIPSGAKPISINAWTEGNIATDVGIEWFKFTAAASTQYLHFSPGTSTFLYAQLYGSNGTYMGAALPLNDPVLLTLTPGSEYYVKTTSDYNPGNYLISVNSSSTPPSMNIPDVGVIQLTPNTWANGELTTANGNVQWFKFTATDAAQYIHFNPGTLIGAYACLYNSDGSPIEAYSSISSNHPLSRTVTSGEVYYLKVWEGWEGTGTFQITFNDSNTPPADIPDVGVIQLSSNTWANGELTTANGNVQWFKFTATDATQYIHFKSGTLDYAYACLYNSDGSPIEAYSIIYSNHPFSRTVTSGEEYYIKVWAGAAGTFQIGFNKSTRLVDNILTFNTWTEGNGEQWFSFIATDTTQYIHIEPINMVFPSPMFFYYLYDANDTYISDTTIVGGGSHSETLTIGQAYYINMSPPGNGTYLISFNNSNIPPAIDLPNENVTQLTFNTWSNGELIMVNDNIPLQWFKFTATDAAQYIHFNAGTLENAFLIRLYASNGSAIRDDVQTIGIQSLAQAVTSGEEYYIRVWGVGAFQIGFTDTSSPPPSL